MKRILLCLTLLCLSPLLRAAGSHDERYQSAPQINFEAGSRAWVLVADANLRALPDAKSPALARLPIGTEIKVLADDKHSGVNYTQNGLSANWLKVRLASGPQTNLEGYLWSGILSALRVASVVDDGTYFYFGIQAVQQQDGMVSKVIGQVRAANHGVELARLQFVAPNRPHFSAAAQSLGNQGLANVNDVLSVSYEASACGEAYGEVLLFWSGTAFTAGETANRYADAPVFHHEKWILPQEPGGKKGVILWRMEAQEDEGTPLKKESAEWLWLDGKMQKR